jgi:hypothetical protein
MSWKGPALRQFKLWRSWRPERLDVHATQGAGSTRECKSASEFRRKCSLLTNFFRRCFRLVLDLGLHLDPYPLVEKGLMSREDAHVRLLAFWGCYVFDKGWAAYLGRTGESISKHVAVSSTDSFARQTPYEAISSLLRSQRLLPMKIGSGFPTGLAARSLQEESCIARLSKYVSPQQRLSPSRFCCGLTLLCSLKVHCFLDLWALFGKIMEHMQVDYLLNQSQPCLRCRRAATSRRNLCLAQLGSRLQKGYLESYNLGWRSSLTKLG